MALSRFSPSNSDPPSTSSSPSKRGAPFFSLIADGVHVDHPILRMAYAAHPERCVLITDALPLLDPALEDGEHPWTQGRWLRKEGTKLFVAGTDTLAGR